VPEHTGTLDEIAKQVRSKNAGPFWVTLDVFLATDDDYRHVLNSGVISNDTVADLYHVDPARVRIFELPNIRVIKVSFPRNVVAGDFEDRDLHAGQQYVVLAGLAIPLPSAPGYGATV
jgi:hypothetical protein